MKSAKVSELKNRLSHYLRIVRAGQPVLIYDRDRVIARIDRVDDPAMADDADAWAAELERQGVLKRPTAKLPARWVERRVKIDADVVSALIDEREGGR